MSPFLSRIKDKGDGFSVPARYFKSLPDEVLRRVGQETAQAEPKRSWLDELVLFLRQSWQPRYAVAFAAAVVLLVAGFWVINRHAGTNLNTRALAEVQLNDISYDALYSYISTNIDDIESDLIVDSETLSGTEKTLHHLVPKPETEEVEEYLDDVLDDIDLEDLEDIF